ncbi:hypothetical protein, partial [Flavobacterium frigidimaris]
SYDESELNKKTKELIDEIFQLMGNFYGNEEERQKEFDSIKELELELKKNININYVLSLKDFF